MMSPQNNGPENADLARVGTESNELPEVPVGDDEKAGGSTDPQKGPWRSSAQEELGRFKGVPVVGTLPWKTQYLVLAGVLAISLIVLVGSVLSSGVSSGAASPAAVSQARGALQQAQMQVSVLARGQLPDAKALGMAREEGMAAARLAGAESAWQEVDQTLGALDPFVQSVSEVVESSTAARQTLQQAHERASAQLDRAFSDGSGQSNEAVMLARMIGHYQVLSELLLPGPSVENRADRIQSTVASIGQGFQAFRNSPIAAQDSSVSRGWRELSAAWAGSASQVTLVQEAFRQNTQRDAAATAALGALASAGRALDTQVGSAQAGGSSFGAWIAAIVALVSFSLLVAVSRKQQRWQLLSVQASNEQHEQAILELMEDLDVLGGGDLTRRARVSTSPIGTLADSVNSTMDKIRQLVQACRRSHADVSSSALGANEAAGVVIATQKDQLSVLENNSQDLFRILENIGLASHETNLAHALAEQIRGVAMTGQGAVGQASDKIRQTKDRVDESASRAQRVVGSSREVSSTAIAQKEISEQLHILGMQAAIQAAKAGDSGQGFRVVAKGIQELAEASEERARNVMLLVETGLSDLEALASSMEGASRHLEDSGRLADVSHESWSAVSDQLRELVGRLSSMSEVSELQEGLASGLDKRTRQDLSRANQITRETQEASEAISKMVLSTQKMDQTISKLKA